MVLRVLLRRVIALTEFPSSVCSSEFNLLRNADVAMYRSREGGGNCVSVFDESMHEKLWRRTQMKVRVRQALAASELTVSCQPIARQRSE